MHRYQFRSSLTLLAVLILIFVAVAPVGAVGDAFCIVVIQPGDTLSSLARKFKTSVFEIVRDNNLTNENLIIAGTVLNIRIGIGAEEQCPAGSLSSGGSSTTTSSTTTTATTSTTATISTSTAESTNAGLFNIEVGSALYSGDGTRVEFNVTVHNISVSPAIAGGKYTPLREDGYPESVTLAKSFHGDFETPLVGKALLWQVIAHLSDGSTHLATVGCVFIEHVFAEGDEPLERDEFGTWLSSFHYEINLYDGWWDCGNTYRVNPEDILPGTSASSVLHVYLVNPHYLALEGRSVGDPYPKRFVTKLVFTLLTPDGSIVVEDFVVNVDAPAAAG